ncbi:MAG: polyprenol monophosphomannose synthase [Thaumarchaeota archaeon]|nr:polyprenol monophosphomannose synthase [Nitrososphaerota archaeon]
MSLDLEPLQRVCAVVPTYNERGNIIPLVEAVKAAKVPGLSLLFVDDSSPDGTGDEIERLALMESWIRVLVRGKKAGIGSAYQDGFREANATQNPDVVLEMDADLQHPPSAIADLVRALARGADVAVGSRYAPGGSIVGWSLPRKLVSKVANSYARLLLSLPVKDATSGFRAYSRRAAIMVSEAELPAKGFEFQVATLKLLKTEMKIVKVPYAFAPRTSGRSKLGVGDMGRFFFAVLRLSLS